MFSKQEAQVHDGKAISSLLMSSFIHFIGNCCAHYWALEKSFNALDGCELFG